MKVVVVDLDGTLCDSAHRVHLAQAAQWDEFHSLLSLDKPFNDVRFLLDVLSLHGDISLIALTGRNESYRNQTYRWFNEHGIIFDHLFMRPDFNYESDAILKPKLLLEKLFDNDARKMLDSVVMILEDRDKMVESWRDLGFACWQVRSGAY